MAKDIGKRIRLSRRKDDHVAMQEQVNWALEQFREKLEEKWLSVEIADNITYEEGIGFPIIVGGPHTAAFDFQHLIKDSQPIQPESFFITSTIESGQKSLVVLGADVRGLVYALLELSDIVMHSNDPVEELLNLQPIKNQPANPVRSINRLFVNEKTDKLWFYDKTFWREYLTELASQRFNRIHLALGMGYDNGHDPDIKDFYFCFAYPFLVSVPGYQVTVQDLTDEERDKNLQMLRFIGQEANRRGLEFQIGLWTHTYEPEESPNIRYKIEGLQEENHAIYCRDALKTLLQSCPEIDGVTIRVHYESGIPEPAHLFWEVVFQGVATCGRKINLDLHPKGIDDELLQVAEKNGVPFSISPKFWAEHMGLPYHQAAIRETELPIEPTPEAGKMIVTTTSRRFTRYGYADFYKEDRNYDLFFRIWPGTQRVLLWGDPEMAAGYGRSGSFLGAKGVEIMEPLSFKSRKTTETPTGRDPYADPALRFGVGDWKKYKYTYRLWGRLLYNPDASPESWHRFLRSEFSEAAESCEKSLKYASRILPLLTVAHSPSVANNNYWPEMYSNIFIIDQEKKPDYHCDGREPHTFNAVSPLDPALFYRVDEFADDMVRNQRQGKISPIQTADLLEDLALTAQHYLQEAKGKIDNQNDPAFRRWVIDIEAQIGLGHFFANKFRAGTAYEFFERVGDASLLEQALKYYRLAKNAWEQVIEATKDVYTDDITYGYVSFMRGHWADRLPAIEEDIRNMENQIQLARNNVSSKEIEKAKNWLLNQQMELPAYNHIPPKSFERGQSVQISLNIQDIPSDYQVYLNYRHANQAESYQSIKTVRDADLFTADIPASYTDSPYPIIYFFEFENDEKQKRTCPGFDKNLSNQPYFSIRLAK
ncbi:hypothetical protein [Neobacillus niacini]|uniref:hypothetical protein n=1 Tax=Neobacillus niacini TaxID=86668 RepID=UPI0020418A22|nr:hypothetical protein [Neobacillus niacini]MCM3689696.1 hypothetical protein [Neobacillus niacini]